MLELEEEGFEFQLKVYNANEEHNQIKVERTLTTIFLAMKKEVYEHIKDAQTAKEAWTNLKIAYESKNLE